MINGVLAFVGLVLMYVCWNISISSWSRLTELGIEHKKSSTTYFDAILSAGFLGLIVSRISWMLLHVSQYQGVPFGLLPYSRSATELVWFTLFPWRILRITEGITFPLLWAVIAIFCVYSIFLPTIKLSRKLRLEKRGIMRAFIVRSGACAALTVMYFAVLTYFAW